MPRKPEILKRETLLRSRLFRADQVQLRFANGEERSYEKLVVGGNGAVLIVPFLDNNTLLLVKEYALGLEDYHIACPKGAIDAGETILEAANRELKEEVGYGARKLTLLKKVYLSPSYMEHGIHIVIAQDLYPERLQGDEPEPIEIVQLALEDLPAFCLRDDICEGRSIAALYMARNWLQANPA